MSEEEECKNCRFFKSSGSSNGLCRRNAPQRNEHGIGVWPSTWAYYWCGQFKQAEGKDG